MKSDKLFIHCINQKKLLKRIQQLNEIIIKNGHHIFEFRKQQNI